MICSACFSGGAVWLIKQMSAGYELNDCSQHLHVRVNDPFEILFTLFHTARAALSSPEQTWVPLNVLLGSLSSLLTLSIFDLGLLVCRKLVISLLYGTCSLFPESLRLALFLFLNWPHRR